MGFTQRFNEAPKMAAMDVNGLLALLNDPKKATELWAKYQEAHASYQEEMAAIEARAAEIEKAKKILWQDNFDLEEEQKKFDEQVKNKTEQFRKWEQDLELTKKNNELTAIGLNDKYKSLQDWQTKLDAQEFALSVKQRSIDEDFVKRLEQLNKDVMDVGKREAAVAEREAKAEKLAKLLKEV